jgi:hypothetical protein
MTGVFVGQTRDVNEGGEWRMVRELVPGAPGLNMVPDPGVLMGP